MSSSAIFAILACGCFSLSTVLVAEVKGRVDPFRMARWQFLTATLATGTVSVAFGGWRSLELWQLGLLALSSIAGIMVASVAYFISVATAGACITALLFSLIAPFSLLLGYLVLGETITFRQAIGAALVLCGIVFAIGMPSLPRWRSRRRDANSRIPWIGIGFGVVTALGQSVSSLLARPVMATGLDPFTAMATRAGLASLVFAGLTLLPMPALQRPYKFTARDLGFAVSSAVAGLAFGTTLLMAALHEGNVGIVATLASMTPIVILPMVWLQTSKAPSRQAWIGAALAVCGTALISL